jgi:hypothetical protein
VNWSTTACNKRQRRTLAQHHSSVLGHGTLISELERRVHRMVADI